MPPALLLLHETELPSPPYPNSISLRGSSPPNTFPGVPFLRRGGEGRRDSRKMKGKKVTFSSTVFGRSINKGCAIPWFKLAPSRDNKKNEDQCWFIGKRRWRGLGILSFRVQDEEGGDGIGGEDWNDTSPRFDSWNKEINCEFCYVCIFYRILSYFIYIVYYIRIINNTNINMIN